MGLIKRNSFLNTTHLLLENGKEEVEKHLEQVMMMKLFFKEIRFSFGGVKTP